MPCKMPEPDDSSFIFAIRSASGAKRGFEKVPLALIGNYVWMDNPDIEGDQDASEMALANVKINLTWAGEDGVFQTASNSSLPAGDDRVYMSTTDASGRYEFRGLIPSTNYRILPDKYTAPNGVGSARPPA